jgi:tRNA (adenine57-N1/adenine58-N1)-methyltransferase catalytic subunit
MVSKILYKKEKTQFIPELNKRVRIVKGKRFFVDDINKDYHTQSGIIKSSELNKPSGASIKSEKNKEYFAIDPSFIDLYKRIERGAQIIPLKDIGAIIANTGIGPNSKVLDSGAGSGAVSIFLSRYVNHVYSYELRQDHYDIVKRNIDSFNISNITLKLKDIYQGIDEKGLDLINLDLPEPWNVLAHLKTALKVGGFLVVYNPSIVQISDMMEKIKDSDMFDDIKTIEIIQREWDVSGRKVRPKTQGIGHSGFLIFARKIK